MSAELSYQPASVSQKMVRQQTFRLTGNNDFSVLIGQLSVLLQQLHSAKFTGKIEIDFSQGSMLSVNSTDSQKI